jgi:uncharacterized protein YgbK (DUF1537 family)
MVHEHPVLPELPVPEETVLGGLPAVRAVPAGEIATAVAASHRYLVVLDDDPTGTQSVADVPVLTGWGVDDLRWGFQQPGHAFFVLTNTRSLDPIAMRSRNEEVVASLVAAARAERASFVVASRSDSTLRGHFPLETDVLAAALVDNGEPPVDGVVIAPAYVDAGRLTVGSVHWMRTPGGLLPVGRSEFAGDATFGFRSSDLRHYVVEKSAGRWRFDEIARITLADLRSGGPAAVAAVLEGLSQGHPVVADAVCDDDLRVLTLGILRAEAAGKKLLYRVGPSFVRARAGLVAQAPISRRALGRLASGGREPRSDHGLVAVGSHVPRTARQLDGLARLDGLRRVDIDVTDLLAPDRRSGAIALAIAGVVDGLLRADVVLCTSRRLVLGRGAAESLSISSTVSAALVAVVRTAVTRVVPRWVVAKGGITSSDIATEGLGIARAWARGTLLPGIISIWEPVDSTVAGVPYVVFPGNVGDDDALAQVVTILRDAL